MYGGISDEERVIREELQQSPRSVNEVLNSCLHAFSLHLIFYQSNFFYVECESPLLTSISVDEAESETSDNLKDPLMITKDQKHNSWFGCLFLLTSTKRLPHFLVSSKYRSTNQKGKPWQ